MSNTNKVDGNSIPAMFFKGFVSTVSKTVSKVSEAAKSAFETINFAKNYLIKYASYLINEKYSSKPINVIYEVDSDSDDEEFEDGIIRNPYRQNRSTTLKNPS